MLNIIELYYNTIDKKCGELSYRKFLMQECRMSEYEVHYFGKTRRKRVLPFANLLTKTLGLFNDFEAVSLLESSMRTGEKISPQAEKAYEDYYKENPHLVPIRRRVRKAHRELLIVQVWKGD